MTDNIEYAFNERVDIELEQAWEVYRDLPQPNAKECARILQQRGFKVSYDTIARWARRGKWRERVEQLRAVAGVDRSKDLAATLKLEAEWVTPDFLKGIQYRLAARMATQIAELPLEKPSDFAEVVAIINALDAVIHRHRGESIASPAGNGSRPIVALDEFKAWRSRQDDD
jgi:hypothetical protein